MHGSRKAVAPFKTAAWGYHGQRVMIPTPGTRLGRRAWCRESCSPPNDGVG
jgi:hypothetical protein